MRRKRGLKGAGHVRRLMKRLPDSVHAEIVTVMNAVRPMAVGIAKGGAPFGRGSLRAALSGRVYPKSARFRVGLLTKAQARRLFYGFILEQGRRAQTVNVRRSTPSGGVTNYAMRVSGIDRGRYDMVGGKARTRILNLFRNPLRRVWDRALRNAAGWAGAPND